MDKIQTENNKKFQTIHQSISNIEQQLSEINSDRNKPDDDNTAKNLFQIMVPMLQTLIDASTKHAALRLKQEVLDHVEHQRLGTPERNSNP